MKRSLVIAVVLIASALMFFPKLDFVRYEPSHGVLLWRDGEAYLLIGDATAGFRLSVLEYILALVKEYFHAVQLPNDKTSSFAMMKITPSGVERYEDKMTKLSRVTPVSEEIYAGCLQGICKWTGTQFETISKDEEKGIGGETRLTDEDFSNIDGWSRRRVWSSLKEQQIQPYNFSADLKDGTTLVVSGYNPVFIDLLRSGHSSERIWYNKAGTRMVSPSEYQRTFRHP